MNKNKKIMELIKFHYEKDEEKFKKTTTEIAKEYDKEGSFQLAEYIAVLNGDCESVWKPIVEWENENDDS